MKRNLTKSKTNKLASRHLGTKGSYDVQTTFYDEKLLVGIPREEARKDWGITGEEFYGYDVWHCYEATFLLNNGMPLTGILKIVYPSYSKKIVESKSFKLYLNSFDMCKMGESLKFAMLNYEKTIKRHLDSLLGVDVAVKFHQYNTNGSSQIDPFFLYKSLEDLTELTVDKIEPFSDYHAENDYTVFEESLLENETFIKTNSLRSRCRHTGQKDSGTFLGYFRGKVHLSPEESLKRVVSLRMLEEFHEFCCEKLFMDFRIEGVETMITLLYSRRGSLDINPVRATSLNLIPDDFIDVSILTKRAMGQ